MLGSTDSSLSLHNDIPATTSQKFQPALLIVVSRSLGPLALSVIVSHFLRRGGNLSSVLGPVQVALQRSPHVFGVHEPMGYAKTLTFQGWFLCSYPILVLGNRDPC